MPGAPQRKGPDFRVALSIKWHKSKHKLALFAASAGVMRISLQAQACACVRHEAI